MTDWRAIAEGLVGTPYAEAPCWELLRRAYFEGHGVALPRYDHGRTTDTIHPLVVRHLDQWDEASPPEPGDAVLLWVRDPARPTHVGLLLDDDGYMLHTTEGAGAEIASLRDEAWGRRVVGYYRHRALRESWTLRATPHPFMGEAFEAKIERGATVLDALQRINLRPERGGKIAVRLGGGELDVALWRGTRPRAGIVVDAESTPSDPITLFFLIGGAVGSALIGAPAGIAAALAITAGVLGTAAIYTGIYFATQALAAPPEPGNQDGPRGPAQSPSASGVGNRADPWGPVPVPYGVDMKIFPRLAAPAYTEIVGGERYWRILLCPGNGRLYIDRTGATGRSGIEIAGVPIEEIDGWGVGRTEFEIFDGAVTDLPGTILDPQPTDDPRQAVPLAYYRLGDLTDELGGASLTAIGGAAVGQSSIITQAGACAALDGVDDCLETTSVVPIANLFDGDFTLVVFSRSNPVATLPSYDTTLLSFGENRGVELRLEGPWRVGARVNGQTVGAENLYVYNPESELVIARRRGDLLEVYANGGWSDPVSIAGINIAAPDRLLIGAGVRLGARAGFFAGRLQEVALFDVALSNDEVTLFENLAASDAGLTTWQSRLLRRSVYETPINEVLQAPVHDQGPFYEGDWFTFNIEGIVNRISADTFMPGGGYRVNDEGKKRPINIGIRWMYRVGDGDWFAAPSSARRSGRLTAFGGGVFGFTGETYDPMLMGFEFDVPRSDGYELRFRVIALDSPNNRAGDRNTISYSGAQVVLAIRGTDTAQAPVRTRGVSYIALSLPVLETGPQVGEISCLVSSMLRTISGGVVSSNYVPTNNAAWVMLDKLIGTATNPRPISSGRVNLVALEAFASRAKPYNNNEDFRSNVRDSIGLTGTGSFASLGYDGKWTVIEDRAGLPTTQALLSTNRNSRSLGGYLMRPDLPHALRIKYIDKEQGWTAREAIAYDDGYTKINATKFQSIEVPGVNTQAAAIEYGRIWLAMARLRNEEWRREMSVDALRVRRGHVARLQDWSTLIGQHPARVVARTLNGGGTHVISITVDETIVYEAAVDYGLVWKQSDDSTRRADVTNPGASESNTITFAAPVLLAEAPALGDHAAFGERDVETLRVLVRDVTRRGLRVELSLVPYAEEVFAAGVGPVEFDPIVSRPLAVAEYNLPAPPVLGPFYSDESMLVFSGADVRPRMRVFVTPQTADRAQIDGAQIRYRVHGTTPWQYSSLVRGSSPFAVTVEDVVTDQAYDVQGRVSKADGRSSRWSDTFAHRVVGTSTPPPDVPEIVVNGELLSWSYPNGVLDLAGYRIRFAYGPVDPDVAWTAAHHVSQLYLGTTIGLDAIPRAQAVTVMIKAVDVANNESVHASSVYLLNHLEPRNVVMTLFDSIDGWGSDVAGATEIGDELVADTVSGNAAALFGDPGAPLFAIDTTQPLFGLMSEEIVWSKEITVPRALVRLFSRIEFPERQPTFGTWAAFGPAPMWGAPESLLFPTDVPSPPLFGGGGPLWGAPSDPLFPDVALWPLPLWTPHVAWPGQTMQAQAQAYQFRWSVPKSPGTSKLTRFQLFLDVDDQTESLIAVPISVEGGRLPLTKRFSLITDVQLTVERRVGETGVSARIIDYEANGPSVEILDAAGDRVAGRVNARVIGAPHF